MEVVYDVLQLIWKTYHYSPKSTRELKVLASELGVDVLKPTQVSGTRWLPHISRALNVLIKPVGDGSGQYAALLCHMDHLSVASKNTDIKGRAKFITEKMRSISFTAFCHFLADMFGIISKLSLKMQRNDLILPVAVSLLHEMVTNVQVLKSRPAPNGHLQRFMNILEKSNGEMQFQGITLKGTLDGTSKRGGARPDNFQSPVTEAVDLCVSGIKERFGSMLTSTSNAQPLTPSTTQVFNIDSWPTSSEDLVDFGNDAIDRLTNWFAPVLQKAGCEADVIPEEWFSLKVLVNTSFCDKDYSSLWGIMLTKVPYKKDFRNVLHLVEIMLVLPISAAQCERAVSAQNRIKSRLRVGLDSSMLQDLIRITAEGPPVLNFDATLAVEKWLARDRDAGERQRQPHFHRR